MAVKISLSDAINWIKLKLQGSAPSSPAAGYGYLYPKTSNKHLFWKDEDGTETDLMDITAASTTTVTGKTINLSDNTLTGTTAQFNTALSDGNFATLGGSETLTSKTLTAPVIADFTNAAHDHGDADDGGSALASPTITTPTISGAIVFPDNVRQTFNPGADAAGLNVGSLAGDPGTPSNGDLWYDSTANSLDARINGATVSLGAGGGSVATDAIWDAKGDLAGGTGANTAAKLTVGTNGQVLSADSGEATGLKWINPGAGTNVATDVIWDAKGDLAGGTGSNTAVRLAVGTNGQVLTADSGETTGMKWAAAPAGTVLKYYWSPDAPPASPTSQDDEFDNASLDVKWTEYDPNTTLTVTESSTYKHLILSATTRTGFNPTGIGQTIPAGDFTVIGKLMFRSPNIDYTVVGLAMWEDISDVSKDIIIYGASPRAAVTPFGVFYYTDSTTFSSQTLALGAQILPTTLYLRIRRNSTNYFYDFSSDGISWEGNSAAVNPAFTPTKFGVAIDNANTGVTISASFTFFRYIASDVGLNGILAGNVAGIYA